METTPDWGGGCTAQDKRRRGGRTTTGRAQKGAKAPYLKTHVNLVGDPDAVAFFHDDWLANRVRRTC